MEKQEVYFTIEKSGHAEFKDRGSKFIAYAFPINKVEDFKDRMLQLKKEHPKATHHCFAYRLGLDGNTFRVSDAGEPSGTAGKPILGQIDSRDLVNVLVVVVRYFGGSLLGVPGLINAYKSVTAMVLQTLPSVQKYVEEEFMVQFDYTMLNEVMHLVKQNNCRVVQQDLQLFCSIRLAVPLKFAADIAHKFSNLKNTELTKIV